MTAVLDVRAAPAPGASPIQGRVELALAPGDLALVHAEDPGMARALAMLCTGLVKLASGQVRFLEQDWAALPRVPAQALRGRIGIAPGDGGWLPHLTVAEGMLLARRHHDDTPDAELRAEAAELCRLFGLDGLPLAHPAELTRTDLARAGCARAFLGAPDLILLESPLDRETADMLAEPLLAALAPARARGAAALWSTRSRRAWDQPGFPASQWWVLQQDGLKGDAPCQAPR
ncbi:ABC transporter ATP-binding protein [Roseomonas frigidaquae]|uniref:ABC transporter ATP-binding protein n=1 Tax=Falsiroseomonas frigidaquae TaxID=487318 RepID=A0ABX1EUF9_9PROT|nr:ABC transporter ATP-binding protein [Falsiroseomonas frigidaquae]NKE44276.1 ABC transporter ATP-binding protein [Falsiroseomonas frigidaquae]